MKVVAFNGSPRKEGNTAILLHHALKALEAHGLETELVNITGKPLRGCTACLKCAERQDKRCSVKNDIINECIEKMLAADGIILGSPTYFSDVTAELKALIDRAGFVAKVNDDMLKRKVGAAVVAVRRAGAVHVFDSINHFFTIGQMVIPGASYWNLGIGLQVGDVNNDEEGLGTMKTLGENMAWVLQKLHG
jgi:multimeric flavodoxin WrbA